MNAIADTPRDRDWLLAAIALGCAIVASVLLAWDPWSEETVGPGAAPVVGTITFSSADLRRRPAHRLGWSNIPRGGELRELDALFVPPGVEAKITFKDGTILELDERSLVVLDLPRAGRRNVSIRQGSVEGSAGASGLSLSTPHGTAQLSPESQAHVEVANNSVALAVTRGEAKLGEKVLGTGERSGLNADGVQAQAKWPVELLTPARNQRKFFQAAAPPVRLSWQGDAGAAGRVQIARDRGFAFVLEEHDAAEGTFTFARAQAGVFWWRVVDELGEPVSESRRITVLEDVPPTLVSPREGEVVLANEQQLAVFSWIGVRGVSHYQLQVSASPAFTTIAWEALVDGAQLRTPLPLDEGRWYWRLRTVDEERGESGPSAARPFRLIHRPLPEAPELLNPEIEVEPAPRK